MLDVTWQDRRRASWIREQMKAGNILKTAMNTKLARDVIECVEFLTDGQPKQKRSYP